MGTSGDSYLSEHPIIILVVLFMQSIHEYPLRAKGVQTNERIEQT